MAQIGSKRSHESDDVSLKDLVLKINEGFKYLLSKWLIIILGGIIGAALGVSYSFLKKPVYIAELTFALEDEKSSGGGLGAAMGLATQFGLDLGGNASGVFSGDNLPELIKSRSMIESALLTNVKTSDGNQTLAELYINYNELRDKWKNKGNLNNIRFLPNSDRATFTLQQDSVLGVFYKQIVKDILTVDKVDKKLSIIKVEVSSQNELFSKYFAETLTRTVADFYIDTKTKKSVHNVTILQRQADSVRRELNAAINGVASSVDYNPNPNPSLQILRAPSQRKQVDVQANQAILTQLVANLELSKVTLRKETPLIQVIDRPILPLEKKKVGFVLSFLLGGIAASVLTMIYLLARRSLNNLINH